MCERARPADRRPPRHGGVVGRVGPAHQSRDGDRSRVAGLFLRRWGRQSKIARRASSATHRRPGPSAPRYIVVRRRVLLHPLDRQRPTVSPRAVMASHHVTSQHGTPTRRARNPVGNKRHLVEGVSAIITAGISLALDGDTSSWREWRASSCLGLDLRHFRRHNVKHDRSSLTRASEIAAPMPGICTSRSCRYRSQ